MKLFFRIALDEGKDTGSINIVQADGTTVILNESTGADGIDVEDGSTVTLVTEKTATKKKVK
jgi:hypothetical protein